MFGIRRSKRGAISGATPVALILVTAVLGGVGAALAVLTGMTQIGGTLIGSALVAGAIEFITLYKATTPTGTIPLKTLLSLVVGAVLVGLEYLFAQPSYATVTVVATVAVAVTYLTTEVAQYISAPAQAKP